MEQLVLRCCSGLEGAAWEAAEDGRKPAVVIRAAGILFPACPVRDNRLLP